MRKEIIIALIVGSALGIFLAIAITSNVQKTPTKIDKPEPTKTEVQTKTYLSIVSPKISDVLATTTDVNGITDENVDYVMLVTNASVSFIKVTDQKFHSQLTLSNGPQFVELLGIKKDNTLERTNYTYTVSTKSDYTGGQSVYSGVITDISEKTMQLRTANSDVRQIVISDNTIYKSFLGKQKDLKLSDIAIGDSVASIGAVSEKGVLSATELFVIDSSPDNSQTNVDLGKISDISKSQFVLATSQDNKTYALSSHGYRLINDDGTVAKTSSSALKKDARVIVTDSNVYIIHN